MGNKSKRWFHSNFLYHSRLCRVYPESMFELLEKHGFHIWFETDFTRQYKYSAEDCDIFTFVPTDRDRCDYTYALYDCLCRIGSLGEGSYKAYIELIEIDNKRNGNMLNVIYLKED